MQYHSLRIAPMGFLAIILLSLATDGSCLSIAVAQSTPEFRAKTPVRTDRYGDPLPAGALARLGTLRWRHDAIVSFVAFTADGKVLVTASRDGVICLHDQATGQELHRNLGGSVVALSPNGKTLATNGDKVIALWDIVAGKEMRRFPASPNGVSALVFAPDGSAIICEQPDGILCLYETATGKELRRFGEVLAQLPANANPLINDATNVQVEYMVMVGNASGKRELSAPRIAFAPDGKTLIAQKEGGIVFWEVATGKEKRRLPSPPGGVSSLALSPDGKLLAYGSGDRIHLWDVGTGKERRQLVGHTNGVATIAFSPDGRTLVAKSGAQRIHRWEVETGKLLGQFSLDPPEGNSPVRLWNVGNGRILKQSLYFTVHSRNNHLGPAMPDLAISPDGKTLAAGSGGRIIRLWDLATGQERSPVGHRGGVVSVAVSPEGTVVISLEEDQTLRLWDRATGRQVSQFPVRANTSCLAVSPDGRRLATAGANGMILLLDTTTGKELGQVQGHANGIAALAFSPDGKTLASQGTNDQAVQLTNLIDGKVRWRTTAALQKPQTYAVLVDAVFIDYWDGGGNMPGLVFSPDGRLLATPGPDNTVRLWDAVSGTEIRWIVPDSRKEIVNFTFSPDGRTLATEHPDLTITFWEVATGLERGWIKEPAARNDSGNGSKAYSTIQALAFSPDGVNLNYTWGGSKPTARPSIAFSPNGRILAQASGTAIRLWDVVAGKELGHLGGHRGLVASVAFAPDGQSLISGSNDTTALVWDLTGFREACKSQPAKLLAADVQALWHLLGGINAEKAFCGIHQLTTDPSQTLDLLRAQLRPARPTEPRRIDQWIANLDSDQFIVRQQAVADLEELGKLVEPALRQVLTQRPTLEVRRRVEHLLLKIKENVLTTNQVRQVRALEVLERLGTAEARQLLEALTRGEPGSRLTREARATLDRLTYRTIDLP